MKPRRSIILKKINKGFSLVEMIAVIAISTFFIVLIVGITFGLYNGFNKARNNAVEIKGKSDLLKIVSMDVLSPDIYPHHPAKEYSFTETSITFFSNGGKITYSKTDEGFVIGRNKTERKYRGIKDFKVKYYTIDNVMVLDESFPSYCEMIFTFDKKNEYTVSMKL
jgi:prepilin-type N-terminal cleavage/methylation domain-containing protein